MRLRVQLLLQVLAFALAQLPLAVGGGHGGRGTGSITAVTYGSSTGAVCDADGASTTITFTHNPGPLPAIVVHPSYTTTLVASGGTASMSVATSGSSGAYGGSASVTGTKEVKECSGRGWCDRASGTCYCHAGFGSSNGLGASGGRGDCSYMSASPTICGGDIQGDDVIDQCYLRGSCGGSPLYQCTCNSGYDVNLGAGCEVASCPTGTSFFDEPTGALVAHTVTAECSGIGVCDRSSSACTCHDGFKGTACAELHCGGNDGTCSAGLGTCSTMSVLATVAEGDDGELLGKTYTGKWDASLVTGCHCNAYFNKLFGRSYSKNTGFDCSEKTCPTGDDPKTFNQTHEEQTLVCTASSGSFTLSFRGRTTADIAYDATAAAFLTTFKTLIREFIGMPPSEVADTVAFWYVVSNICGQYLVSPYTVCSINAGLMMRRSLIAQAHRYALLREPIL